MVINRIIIFAESAPTILQNPSLKLPVIFGEADFALGSRRNGGKIGGEWSSIRRLISFGATFLWLIPQT